MAVADKTIGTNNIIRIVPSKRNGTAAICPIIAEHTGFFGNRFRIQDILPSTGVQKIHLAYDERCLPTVSRQHSHKASSCFAADHPLLVQCLYRK